MTALPTALSLSDSFTKVGAVAAFVALVGIAILALLFFSQARELKRLREWAGRAPERAAELEQRVTAGATARVQQAPAVPPVRQVPRTTPVVARPAAASAVGVATRVVPTPPGEDAQAAVKDAGQAQKDADQVTPKSPDEAGVIAPLTAAGAAVPSSSSPGGTVPPAASPPASIAGTGPLTDPGASAPDTGQTEVSPGGAPSTPAGSSGTAVSPAGVISTGEISPGTPGARPAGADSREGWDAVRAKTPSAQPAPSSETPASPDTPPSSSSSPAPPIPAPAAPATAAAAARAQAGQAAATGRPQRPHALPPRPASSVGESRVRRLALPLWVKRSARSPSRVLGVGIRRALRRAPVAPRPAPRC